MIRIAVSGCCGKMGRRIAFLAGQDKNVSLAGGLEDKNHPDLGKDMGLYSGVEKSGLVIKSGSLNVIENADVLIEFSTPSATIAHLKDCLLLKKPIVIGTTGLNNNDEKKIKAASKKIAVVKASNMSIGINLLFSLLADVVKKIGSYYDIEIIEAHHNQKKDSPSGTALSLADIICKSLGLDPQKALRFGREGHSEGRASREIGLHSVRAGEIVGDHTILFAGHGECLELTHRAQSRDTFARGAILAAQFLSRKKTGLYNMQDVLKEKI